MTSFIKPTPRPTGDVDVAFYPCNADALLYSRFTPEPAMLITADYGVSVAGNLTVSGNLAVSGTVPGSVAIGLTEQKAGWSFLGSPVYARAVTGTTPAMSGSVVLFRPSTGTPSRMLSVVGWVVRSGTNQRHIITTIDMGTDTGHASMVTQNINNGDILMYSGNSAYAGQAYSIAVYYTL